MPEFFVDDRTGGRSAHGGRNAAEFGPFDLRPRTQSRHGSTVPDTLGGDGRCTASPLGVRGRHTGRQVRYAPLGILVPPAQTGRIHAGGRCEPLPRYGGPCGRAFSGLGLLTYGTIDRDSADHGSAVNTIFPCGRRRHRPRGPRYGWRKHGVAGRRMGPGRGGGRGRRRHGGRGSKGNSVRRPVGGRRRGPGGRASAGGRVDLRERVAALCAEERSFGG